MRLLPRSIRLQMSLLLLMSTLNAIALAGGGALLLADLAQSPPAELLERTRATNAQLDALSDVLATTSPADIDGAAVAAELDAIAANVEAARVDHGVATTNAIRELADLRRAAERLLATPIDRDGQAVDQAELAARQVQVQTSAHRVDASLAQLTAYSRPAWVSAALTWSPLGMAWVMGIGLLTVGMAWSLRSELSRPLRALADAATTVGSGQLDAPLPEPTGASEVQTLAKAVHAMRDRLRADIRTLDARNHRESAILAAMSDGVVLTDEQGQILATNPPAERLLAWLADRGGPWRGRVLGELLPALDAPVRNVDAGATTTTIPLERRGPRRHVFVDAIVRPVPGEAKGGGACLVALRDVSRERELERLQQEFLSVITHELKTPLTAILGYARLLERGKGGPLSPRQTEFVQTISGQAVVLRTMVQNLLDTSRLEGGQLPFEARPTPLAGLAQDAMKTWEGSTTAAGLRFTGRLDAPDSAVVRVDPFRIQQVLGNLIQNAQKFTPSGGEITVSCHVDGETGELGVHDTGRGIPAEAQPRIFDKFYQVESGDTRKAGGAGLGLFICRQLIEAQGGTIGVRSVPDEGSHFWVRLPLVSETQQDEDPIP